MTDNFDADEPRKGPATESEANDIRRLVADTIYRNEAEIAGVAVGAFDEAKAHSVSGMDKRVAKIIKEMDVEPFFSLYDAQNGFLDDVNTVIDIVGKENPDLFLLLVENAAKSAAWSLGERTKIPFIMHEAATFRVSAEYSEADKIESSMTASGIRLFIPSERDTLDSHGIFRSAQSLAEYAVISSFMMHDVDLQDRIKAGDKAGAAAIALSSLTLSEKILENATGDSTRRNESIAIGHVAEEAGEGFVVGPNTSHIESILSAALVDKSAVARVYSDMLDGMGSQIISRKILEIRKYSEAEVSGSKKERDSEAREARMISGVNVHENPVEKDGARSFHAKFKTEQKAQRTLDAIARELATLIELADRVKKKDEESGEGEGEGQGQGGQGLADAILSKFASEQGKGEGRADAQGQADAGGPSNEERIAKIGIFGSDAEGARFNELLARVDWHTATLQDSPVDWTDYLHGALLRATGIDRTYTWTRPSRRYASMGIYVPGFKRRRCKRLALCIDESGSIDMPKLEKFNEEIIRVIDTVNPEGVDVIHFSTQIAEESLIQGEIWEAKRLLNGGTSFKAAFQAVANRMAEGQEYDAIVFFTDMEDSGYWGLSRANVESVLPNMPEMFWVAYGGCNRKPDFGTLINMDTGELGEFS